MGSGQSAATTPAINILLVDDRAENLIALERVLARPERTLFRAASGNEALRLLLKHEFAVVLLDVEMPDMDGYETARLIRGMEATRSLPIIFVTAGDRNEDRVMRGYELGAVDFLYKPINVRILTSKVDVFVELHRRNVELGLVNAQLERTTAALQDKIADLEFVNRTMSHDLRAPLRSIHGFSQMLAESLEGSLDDERADHLARILRACERMERILDELFGLLQAASSTASWTEVDTGVVLDGVVESLGADIARAGAVVTHDPLPSVRGSGALLAQIFQNLIVNALKFRGDRPPHIHVDAQRAGDSWHISVRDNGLGIPADERGRVFGLFARAGAAAGAGVGLALSRRAVEKHGGRIWVEPAPGGGSVFTFSLPA